MNNPLNKNILHKKKTLAIVGLGYVGLPLAITFSKTKKFKIIGFDLDKKKIEKINKGKSYFEDILNNDIKKLIKSNFFATNQIKYLNKADFIVVALPTPITNGKQPDNSNLISFARSLEKIDLKGKVICLESTVYPTATEEIFFPIINKQNLKIGKNCFLGYSPERIDPSNKMFKLKDIPKIISGYSEQCLQIVDKLYSTITKTVRASSIQCAEFTKCYENVFRSINISFANEMKMLSHKINVDIFETINLANTKPFGIYPFYPGPGMGGHCIPVDPFILSWYAKQKEFYARFIELSGEINDKMPNYIIDRILGHAIKNPCLNKKILLLGLAYKKNIGDMRESPSLKIIQLLKKLNFEVYCNDPHVNFDELKNLKIKKIEITKKSLNKFRYTICITDHDVYDYVKILEYSNFIVDTRNRFPLSSKKVISA